MSRKTLSLEKYLFKNLAEKNFKRIKGVIGMLREPKDFLTVLIALDGQDRKNPETIDFYETLFRSFRTNSRFIDCYLTKQEWHDWTITLLHFSNILWKLRNKFEPCMWTETNKKIYEITFNVLKSYDSEKRDHRECKHCSALFSAIISNFTSYGEEGDIEKLKIPSINTMKEICEKNIGRSWYYLTCGSLVEQRINA